MRRIDLIQTNSENNRIKRKIRKREEFQEEDKFVKTQRHNALKGISKDWCSILNIQCILCPNCIKITNSGTMNSQHRLTHHNIQLRSYKEIWDEIVAFYVKQVEGTQEKTNGLKIKLKRRTFTNQWNEKLKK